MKHLIRTISALVLALTMVLTMGTGVFADDNANTGNTFDIDKEILVFNNESINVYGPGIVYNYSVENGPAGKTVTDKDGDSITVKAGISGGLTLTDSEAVFSQDTSVAATSDGTSIKDTITASIDLSKFTGAGVYRYVIREAKPDSFAAAGLTRPEGYVADRYVDVYIQNGTNGLAVAGTVVFIGDKNISPAAGKTTGFVDSYDSETGAESGAGMADRYYTFNYILKKSIVGTMADKTHAFPFNIATSGVVGQKFAYVTAEGTVEGAVGTDVGTALSDTQTIEIKGLPANTKITVTETNDTPDTYLVSAADETAGKLIEAKATATNGANSTVEMAVSDYADNNKVPAAALSATTFTNELNEVSPTNVVLRFAPYLFILGGAIVLLAVSRRRKAEQE